MNAPSSDSLCKEAEPYYYDFLYDQSHGAVSESIINHIEQCQHCQEQINQLKEVLSQAKGIELQQSQVGSAAVTEMLNLHFAYLGKRVTCETVKSFLPSLALPALKVGVPTPITVHLDKCQQCENDLEAVRQLNLTHKQLCRLGQLFADESGTNAKFCAKARNAMHSVAAMVFEGVPAEVLKHLCRCPDCRGLLYEERQKMYDSLPEYAVSPDFPCESVSATDIFDYVMPYGLDPADDQYAKFRQSFTSHLRTCPDCLAKMQQLHNTAYGIAERAESDVVTTYHIDESAKARAVSESDDLYAGFPIRVEIASREDEVGSGLSASTIDFGAALKQKVSAMNLKPLVRTAAVAAAVTLIAVALLLNIPTAKAVTIGQVYKAIEKVKNVHIASFVPDKKEPIQEQWVSRTLNIYIIKTEEESVLWDLSNKVKKTKMLGADSVETTPLSNDVIGEVERKIAASLGLMPFYDISEFPQDAEWNRITDDLEGITKGTEVYDLTWIEKKHGGSEVFWKWRVSVDTETNRPQKTEYYRKLPADSKYTLRSMLVVEYLSDSEMKAVIKDASF